MGRRGVLPSRKAKDLVSALEAPAVLSAYLLCQANRNASPSGVVGVEYYS